MDIDSETFYENFETLSDIPSDIEDSDSEFEDISEEEDDFGVPRRFRVMQIPSYSDSDEDVDVDMEWTENDTPRNNEDFVGDPGVKVFPGNSESIEEVASLFMDDDIFESISEETNRYYNQNHKKYKDIAKTRKWVDTTTKEIKAFFALLIIMGQVRKDKLCDYWSTNPLIETPIFSKTMARNRFFQILTFLHFSNNEERTEHSGRLCKVQNIIDYFMKKFNSVYKPKQNLSLDESIIPWRGRLKFRVYNPSKINKYGVLVRMLCEATTGYICNFVIYAGRGSTIIDTVSNLLGPYSGLWHHIFMDNYYNSVQLSKDLLAKKFRICGTIRLNRGLPDCLKRNIKLKPLQSVFRRMGDILIQIWKNSAKRVVRMITTIHDAEMVMSGSRDKKTGGVIQKPKCINDYNKYMKGVDRADQYLSYYSIFRKTRKWSKKVVFFLFNCAMFNSYCVYANLNQSKSIKYKAFLLGLAQAWLNSYYNSPSASCNAPQSSSHCSRFDSPGRLSGNLKMHTLRKIVSSKTNKNVRRPCRVCSAHKKRGDSSYMCTFCKVPLHMGSCYEDYHTKKNY